MPPLYSSRFFQVRVGRVFQGIVLYTLSQEMQRTAPDYTVTKKSMVPVLKHVYAHSCTDSLYKQCLRLLPWYWQGSPGADASSHLVFRSSPPTDIVTPRCSNYLPSTEHPCLHSPKLSLFDFVLVTRFILLVFVVLYYTSFCPTVFPHQFLFSFLFRPSLPPCLLQLNKQTNSLPPDTRLRRGDLLCLSGRILSDIVAPVNIKKLRKPEGWCYLCVGWIISPTRRSAFPHCLA